MANAPAAQAHNPREHSQVQTAVPTAAPSALEFSETTTVSLEWRLTGLRAMYDSSKGESKSKCIKSAIFGDPDNLWEVLWYPNSGAQGGDHASLYLSCVPTQQERELAIGTKWVRKGLWWFRFEVKVAEERSGKLTVIASKDASDHTFAAKTGNWGWQQFAKRDQLFVHPAVLASDSFIIVCTISSQPQPPAGYWLGLTARSPSVSGSPNPVAWTGGEGASGGIAGGTMAAGGPKRVVPRDLVAAVGDLFDDPLYSDVEFVIVPSSHKARTMEGDRPPSRRLYANKKLLNRCEYFDALFHGGYREGEGTIDEDDLVDDDIEVLSDSDQDDELDDLLDGPLRSDSTDMLSSSVGLGMRDDPMTPGLPKPEHHHAHTSGDVSENVSDGEEHSIDDTDGGGGFTTEGESGGEGGMREARMAVPELGDTMIEGIKQPEPPKMESPIVTSIPLTRARSEAAAIGPKKTRIIVRDAAWSTWWAVLYWLYTDTIYFAPLASSFGGGALLSPHRHARAGSVSLAGTEPRSRREWIATWLSERGYANLTGVGDEAPSGPLGPRPVSAKAVYRLADRLDLPALRLRAFQHICGQLTAQNIPAEVFSRFSSTFEEVRKVQVAFFLKHWGEIKKSETMQNIWKQIRDGKHVGFEEVWPLIVGQLDFRPS